MGEVVIGAVIERTAILWGADQHIGQRVSIKDGAGRVGLSNCSCGLHLTAEARTKRAMHGIGQKDVFLLCARNPVIESNATRRCVVFIAFLVDEKRMKANLVKR